MVIVNLLPVIISIALLAAHYYRAGLVPLVFVVSGSLLVLFVRKKWSARIMQVELVIGGLEWIRTTLNLISVRQSMSMPWGRMAAILGTVALVAVASAFVFRTESLKKRFNIQ